MSTTTATDSVQSVGRAGGAPGANGNGSGSQVPNSFQPNSQQSSPLIGQPQINAANASNNNQASSSPMGHGSEPFYLKQHYKDQLAYLERDSNEGSNIQNVWVYNFEHELAKISELLKTYTYVAMDTEFPGFLESDFESGPEDQRQYIAIKNSVDKLKIIQLGITLSDENGKLPTPVSTWQFNFDWDIDTERKAEVSIIKLKECGLDFNSFKHHGINPQYFAEKAMASGLVLNDRLTWICFHGNQDFGFLIKIFMNENLPPTRQQFEKYLEHYTPNVLDIKSFMHQFSLYGGLEKIAKQLHIVRMGSQHQAGSDSLVTLQVLFRLFNNFDTDQDRKNYQEVFDQYNQDLYGFSNDQAFHTTYPSEQPISRLQQVSYPPNGPEMHVPGHMGSHAGVHHGVPMSANGSHMQLNLEMDDGGFHHEQDGGGYNMDERMMNFRPNQMNGFGGPNRMQPPFEYMNQQQQMLAGYHQQQQPTYMDQHQQQPMGMHGSPGPMDQNGSPNIPMMQFLLNNGLGQLQGGGGDFERRGAAGGQQLGGGQPWGNNQMTNMHDGGQGNGGPFFNPQYYQQN